jgi:hypothetical protein
MRPTSVARTTVSCVREVATETDVEVGRCVTCDARDVDSVHRTATEARRRGDRVLVDEPFRAERCLACWRADAVEAAARARLEEDDLDAFLAIGRAPAPRPFPDELEPTVEPIDGNDGRPGWYEADWAAASGSVATKLTQ